ncbi:hypothetical protein G9A89_018935 [Geosiphon pyriformis]|nr:hypothetical protein G9A89_018935 [Geosiphon pyriformis]
MEDDDCLETAKQDFLGILRNLNHKRDLESFQTFVNEATNIQLDYISSLSSDFNHVDNRELADTTIAKIIHELREMVPITAEAPNEKFTFPVSDFTPETTIHVDSFLYTDENVDKLCDEGKLSRSYCVECGSRNIRELHFITHSASPLALRYIFDHALKGKTDGKVILEIGSRLGGVLYFGYFYSQAKKLIGVELNPFFAKLQKGIVEKYNMQNRIDVIQDDVLNHKELLQLADIIIMHNVFQFFHSISTQQHLWSFIRENTRPSALLVTIPSLKEQLSDASSDIDLKNWVKEVKLKIPNDWILTEEDGDILSSVHLYWVREDE